MELKVIHEKENERFVIYSEGNEVYIEYTMEDKEINLYHTFTHPNLRGKGLAAHVVRAAFEFAKENKISRDLATQILKEALLTVYRKKFGKEYDNVEIDFDKKLTAIKIHFGEPGNLAYIRPNYVLRLIQLLKKQGALPFLTDSNTLYKGRRATGVDHIESAFENGFNPFATGCPVIIADGIKGTEYREIEINQKPSIKKAKP
jgi:predicted GNAT family acetyltransferase